jgi:opacity protein-like surface antigen
LPPPGWRAFALRLRRSAPPPMPEPMDQAELGSNWYIRGDLGYGKTNEATVNPEAGLFPTIGNMPIGDASSPVGITRGDARTVYSPDFTVGAGYRVNDWFRAEATWTISQGPGYGAQQNVYCPEQANAVSNNVYTNPVKSVDSLGDVTTTYTQTAVPVGYQYDYTTCNGRLNGSQWNNTGLVMGYVDLGHYWLFTPYIGIGAGVNINSISGTLTFNQTDSGATYSGAQVSGTAPGVWVTQTGTDIMGLPSYGGITRPNTQSGQPQPIGSGQNWNRTIDSTKYTIAAAVAAGVGVKLSQSATLDLGYKFTTYDIMGGFKGARQSATVGVRYNLN